MKRKNPVPASERMFKLFVEFAPAAIAMFDREMRYIAVSQRFISDYQLINKDIIGHSHYEIFPEISEKWKAIHRSCMAGATAAMSGFARILQESYSSSLDSEGNRVLEVITGNAKKMGILIDDLLEFSRLNKQEAHLSSVNMHDIAESVYLDLASEKEREKTSFILHDLPAAFGDAAMINQVWVNLIGNAVKFSAFKDKRLLEIDGYEKGTENIYFIKDNGVGFNMKYANKLFGVFQRLHSANQFEGTGVGLAIVQRIIFRLKGRVWAEGTENVGATFYFTLPNRSNA